MSTTNATSDKQKQLKYVANVVRALVTSRKPPIKLREIVSEYPTIEGKPLPYRNFGYNTAEEFLKATGEFTFNHYGSEVHICAKPSNKTAHIASMVRDQKRSKSSHINKVQPVRQPKRSDQSWNKSNYSSNVYQRLPAKPSNNRGKANSGAGSGAASGGGDRNNNHQKSIQQRPQQQQQTNQQHLLQAIQRQQSQPKEREMLNVNSKQQQKTMMTTAPAGGDLRDHLNAKRDQQQQQQQQQQHHHQQREQQQMQAKQQLQQQQQAQIKQQTQQLQQTTTTTPPPPPPSTQNQQKQPRPILGKNNNNVAQAQELLRNNNAAIAIASTLILAQREQDAQQQQQRKRAEMVAQQQQQRLQQAQKLQQRTNVAAAAAAAAASAASTSVSSSVSKVQDRLRVRIHNTNGGYINGGSGPNSAGVTPETSPALSSASSEQYNPFGNAGVQQYQPPQFHKQRFLQQQQQKQAARPIIAPGIPFQFNPKLDAVTSLSQYCYVRRYEAPMYTTLRSKYSKLYTCRVNVNGTIFSTYPNEYNNEHLAQISSAQKAIEQLRIQEARRPLPPCMDSDGELTQKLYDELLQHPNGIFAKNIPEWFEEAFQQVLPEHWWTLVQSSHKFTTETTPSNGVIIFANTEAEKDELLLGKNGIVIQMDGIKLPWAKKYWDLHITYCGSTVDVWARLFGKEYSERFEAVMADIEKHMLTEKTRPLSIVCNNIYLVYLYDCWHRVRAEEVDTQNALVRCFFIDFGDTESVAANQLHICEPKFLRLPPQAVPFSLFGLEDFADNPNARRHLDALLPGKSLVGEILTKETDFYNTDASTCGKVTGVLYDTSSEDDVNLNAHLVNSICKDMPPPELKYKGATNVLVTHVNDLGEINLQILNNDLKYVQKLMQNLIESKFKREQHKITHTDLKRSNLFLICDDGDDSSGSATNGSESGADSVQTNWYRGALTAAPFSADDEHFEIFYVDYGITRRIHISKIYRLESLSTALSKFPRQAIKVRLHNVPPITSSIVGRMRALLPPKCTTFVKLSSTEDGIPCVTIYRRHESSDMLCNINEDLRMEHELECSADSAPSFDDKAETTSAASHINLTRGLTINSCAVSSPTKLAELPKLKNFDALPYVGGDFLEVHITLSANPSNFRIQPYKHYKLLSGLMKELQEYCEKNEEFIPADMVEIGQAYAAKNPDGFYHRVTVVATYNVEMIHVCFCDFGDILILRSDQLKILPAHFRQLPKMAIAAKLHGIKPKDGEWNLEDCQRFRKLTVGKKFMAMVKKVSDEIEADSQVLELELIDVTTDEDIYITNMLLAEERGVSDVY